MVHALPIPEIGVKFFFWMSTLWVGYVYFGYPAVVWLLGAWCRCRPTVREDFWPSVSVLMSAYNEEQDIGWKVRETLQWNYPPDQLQVLVASDASQDRTDEILQAIRDPRLVFVRMQQRGGKNSALNALSERVSGDLLVFTDANSQIGPDCLRRMVRYFADPRVGCVTGVEENPRQQDDPAVSSGEEAFLDYESRVKSLESRLGSVLICDGAIFCIRRSLYSPLQPDLANDLELPLRIGAAGYWILCELTARSIEKATRSVREDFNRRCRISGQGILAAWRLRRYVRGLRGWQFFSRKLLRWFTVVPLLLALIASARLAASPLFAALLGLQIMFYTLALAGGLLTRFARNSGGLVFLPFYFVLANVAAITGVVEASLGRRFNTWESPSLSRGGEASNRGRAQLDFD